MDRSVKDVLIEAIGEEAAGRALDALIDYAEQLREGRQNCRAMIVFEHPRAAYSVNWGKLVTEYTREIDDDK